MGVLSTEQHRYMRTVKMHKQIGVYVDRNLELRHTLVKDFRKRP